MVHEYLIVLVEDTPSHADLIMKVLTHYKYKVNWQKTGYEAIAYSMNHKPDLLLIDVALPDISGVKVMQKLRNEYEHLPMIAITAHSMEETEQEMLALGFNEYLSKPFKINDLVSKVKKYLPDE